MKMKKMTKIIKNLILLKLVKKFEKSLKLYQFSQKIILVLVLALLLSSFFNVQSFAQVNLESGSSYSPVQINEKADLIESKKSTRERLNSEKNKLETEKNQLRSQIVQKESEIVKLQEDLDRENDLSPLQRRETADKIDEYTKEIEQKNRTIRGNQSATEVLNKEIQEIEKELEQDQNTFRSLIIGLLFDLFGYISLIILYWITYRISVKFLNRLENKKLALLIRRILLVIILVITFLTILFAFIRNLSLLLGGFGLASAALVVALQDFVSSFFAWLLINSSKQYSVGDIIELQTPGSEIVFGRVKEIGLFRTFVREMEGGEKENKERSTGRIVSFPNNLFLKVSVTNYTQETKILWHNLNLIVTFECSFEESEKTINKITNEVFEHLSKNKKDFLENISLKNVVKYNPKIYLSIDSSGPQFSIWFACQAGKYREVLEIFSRKVLKEFDQNPNLDLAYPTRRVVSTQFLPDNHYNHKFALNDRFDGN